MSGYLALLYQANGLTHCRNIVKFVQKVIIIKSLSNLVKIQISWTIWTLKKPTKKPIFNDTYNISLLLFLGKEWIRKKGEDKKEDKIEDKYLYGPTFWTELFWFEQCA